MAFIGIGLLVCAVLANQQWLDRHFLPSWFMPRQWFVSIESLVRAVIAVAGLSIALFGRRPAARLVASSPSLVVSTTIAAVLALGASDLVLRHVHLRAAEWLVPDEEPRRRDDPRLGWTFVPARTGHIVSSERTVDYAFDAAGYRVRRADEPIDFARPTIVFAGESVMFGEGLPWDQSVPAQVGAMLGFQSANLAVHGYSNDQAYLRLAMELPRFRRPVAVVSLFMTDLFGRNLDDDRPHLEPGLVWRPAEQHGRLSSLAKLLVPYRREATVARGMAVTREVLHATIDLARARAAAPLIVVPHYGQEDRWERSLRMELLDEAGLPYLAVQIDPAWHLPWDRHPDARAAHVIAAAVAVRLRDKIAPGT